MKALVYGFNDIRPLRWKFGEGEYLDVSGSYTDLIAVPADLVIISLSNIEPAELEQVKEYENETYGIEQAKFVYVDDQELMAWDNAIEESLDQGATIGDINKKIQSSSIYLKIDIL